MPYVNNNRVKIYYEVEGQGPPLVLAHGLWRNLESWRTEGYVRVLRNDFRLVLYDSRGHGKSDKPKTPEAYSLEKRTGDALAVLDDLGIDQAHYFGFSWGGRIGFEVALRAPERIKSLIVLLGAAVPQGRSPETATDRIKKLTEQGLAGLVTGYSATLKRLGILTPEREAELKANDVEAQIALHKAPTPNLESELPRMIVPVLLFGAEYDPTNSEIIAASKLLPHSSYIPLPGLDHLGAFCRSDLLLPHVKKFLANVSKTPISYQEM